MNIREACQTLPTSRRFLIVYWIDGQDTVIETCGEIALAKRLASIARNTTRPDGTPAADSVDVYDRRFGGLVSELEAEKVDLS